MDSRLKKLWLQSFIIANIMKLLRPLMPVIPIIIETFVSGLFKGKLSIDRLSYVLFIIAFRLFIPTIVIIFFGSLFYYYIYKLESKHALKFLILVSCLSILKLTNQCFHEFYNPSYNTCDIESIICDCFLLCIELFYFARSYFLYKSSTSKENIVTLPFTIALLSIVVITKTLLMLPYNLIHPTILFFLEMVYFFI